jgi:hypothetical protein
MPSFSGWAQVDSVSFSGLPPGASQGFWAELFWGEVVTVTAQPLFRSGASADRAVAVTDIRAHVNPSGGRTVQVVVRNVGSLPTNFSVRFVFAKP